MTDLCMMETVAFLQKRPFPVTGMSCASCAVNVERALQRQPGVVQAAVNYVNASAQVEYDPAMTDPKTLRQAVRGIGYDLLLPKATDEPDADGPDADDPGAADPDASDPQDLASEVDSTQRAAARSLRNRMIWAIALSIPQVVLSMGSGAASMFAAPGAALSYILWALSTPVVLIFGWPFFRHAWQQARHATAGMDTLVALSTGSAYLYSVFNTLFPQYLLRKGLSADVYFEASSVVIAFILLGKWLEDRAKASAGDAIRRLMHLQPSRVTLEDADGSIRELPLRNVSVGDRLLIRPGERVAVDGLLLTGESYVDESMLSGEPVPVPKHPGDTLFAGTLNTTSPFRMQATQVGKATVLAGIIQRVREAQGSKAPVQGLVDKVAAVFVPVVLGIALLSAGLWWGLGGTSALPHAFFVFVTVLVIACPCALGLATPTALMVGIGKGAAQGIFIKDAASLERLRQVNTVVLDKTGTLTEGKPSVRDIRWFGADGASPMAEAILYSLERASEHPLAGAICAALEGAASPAPVASAASPALAAAAPAASPALPGPDRASAIPLLPMTDLRAVTGSGVEGTFARKICRVGSASWLASLGITLPEAAVRWAGEQDVHTVVFFARGEEVLAGIALLDLLRPGAKAAVQALQARGIDVHMLTGDGAASAAAIAGAVGILTYRSSTSPKGKADYVRTLQTSGARVAMAGDGINDAEALAAADVGIAMGSGTDIAMSVAGMTLVGGDLGRIPVALDLSAATFRAIRQNLGFAFVYNIIGIPVAAGALYPAFGFLLSPMIAGAAMALSSITVVGNSLRLKWSK